MGSSYFGEPNMGNERGISGSTRKGKKSSNSENKQPKQPQRGLGVAQLEKIRLHGQMASFHPSHLHPPPTYPSNHFINNNMQEDPRVQMAYSSLPSSSTSYSPPYAFQPHIMMGLPEYERTNIRYGDSQQTNTTRWEHANAILENQSSAQANITRPFLNLYDSQDHIDIKKHDRSGSLCSNSQNSESSDTQELDLELRLSL